jgi:hypothetical protein
VTIFGSARAPPGSGVYDQVKRLASALAEMGCDIVTGGGPGLLQAANEGARQVNAPERNRSVRIRVDLPFEQDVNPFVEQAFAQQTFFTRRHHFVLASDAFVAVRGVSWSRTVGGTGPPAPAGRGVWKGVPGGPVRFAGPASFVTTSRRLLKGSSHGVPGLLPRWDSPARVRGS